MKQQLSLSINYCEMDRKLDLTTVIHDFADKSQENVSLVHTEQFSKIFVVSKFPVAPEIFHGMGPRNPLQGPGPTIHWCRLVKNIGWANQNIWGAKGGKK